MFLGGIEMEHCLKMDWCGLYATREITAFVILQHHMKYTLSRTKIKALRDIVVYQFLFYICLFVAATLL